MERFAIVQWEDMLSSIVNLDKVKFPKKTVSEYTEGDFVVALFGKQAYKARISEISVVSGKTATSRSSLSSSSHSASSSSSSSNTYSSKRKIDHLEKELKALKKRIKILETKSDEAKSPEAECFRGTDSLENTMKCIEHIPADDINSVMRVITQSFSEEELVSCNRKGKKTRVGENGPIKPALDEQKLFFVEQVVCKKCPKVTRDIFVKKFDNILKVVRRKKQLKQD